jgi:hypothetical protein
MLRLFGFFFELCVLTSFCNFVCFCFDFVRRCVAASADVHRLVGTVVSVSLQRIKTKTREIVKCQFFFIQMSIKFTTQIARNGGHRFVLFSLLTSSLSTTAALKTTSDFLIKVSTSSGVCLPPENIFVNNNVLDHNPDHFSVKKLPETIHFSFFGAHVNAAIHGSTPGERIVFTSC